MDGQDNTPYTDFFPPSLNDAAARVLEESDWHSFHVGNAGATATAVLAPDKRPFAVGKPAQIIDINHFHSSGHLSESLVRETARQYGITLPGELRPCSGCLEVKGMRAGVPRRTTSRAGRPMETVNIDSAGPYEASMGGSAYLIMFVDNASRWMRPYGMNKSETTMYVQKFIADMNNQGRPLCFRTDNGGEFYRGDRLELRRLLRLSRDTPRVHGPG